MKYDELPPNIRVFIFDNSGILKYDLSVLLKNKSKFSHSFLIVNFKKLTFRVSF